MTYDLSGDVSYFGYRISQLVAIVGSYFPLNCTDMSRSEIRCSDVYIEINV